jgi:mono/diheme cytochrome c family protein
MRLLMTAAALLLLLGCKAGQPGQMENRVITSVKQNVTVGGKDWKNPIPSSPEAIQAGADHFRHHCAICHGNDGQNTGVPFADRMDPPVENLASQDVQGYADGQLKWIIENGISPSGMPGWKGILTDEEMWNMVHFMRNLPEKGSAGVPAVFQESAEQHQDSKGGKSHTHSDGKDHKH